MTYVPNSTWVDGAAGLTPTSAARLNNMETGIARIDGRATYSATPADPTGTTNLVSYKMMGLAGAITPAVTGKVLFTICGSMNNSVSGDGLIIIINTGTGTAPVNGAALAGTSRTNPLLGQTAAANQNLPFSVSAIVTGLTLATAYWFDLAVLAITGGTANVARLTMTAVEI